MMPEIYTPHQKIASNETKVLRLVHDLAYQEPPSSSSSTVPNEKDKRSKKRKNEPNPHLWSFGVVENKTRRTKSYTVHEPFLSHETVKQELKLRNGAIQLKPLRLLFGITKASSPRRHKIFREIVKDLCFLKLDCEGGMFLVLKSLRQSLKHGSSLSSSSSHDIFPQHMNEESPRDYSSIEDENWDKVEAERKAKIERFRAFRERAKNEAEAKDVHFDCLGQRVLCAESVRRRIILNHGSVRLFELENYFSVHEHRNVQRLLDFDRIINGLCYVYRDTEDGYRVILRQEYAQMR